MTETTNEQLKPCPFCGGEPLESRIEPHKHHIVMMPDYPGAWCVECPKCEFQLFDHDTQANVVAAWNRRATPAQTPMHEQNARFAIDGAISFGIQGDNKPPTDNHWLMEYWQIGRKLAAQTAAQPVGERELFERWAQPDFLQHIRLEDGTYRDNFMQAAWGAWTARAALSQSIAAAPAQEPVAWRKPWPLGPLLRSSLLGVMASDRHKWEPLYTAPIASAAPDRPSGDNNEN
jgi:Lar family restriction alleviation protein